ncbi:PAS domain S-box protein [Candidatus Gracilibacteria bacterium]|nr:PAS domain S-box protein [Candidatus Gracilibacteria bacterium]
MVDQVKSDLQSPEKNYKSEYFYPDIHPIVQKKIDAFREVFMYLKKGYIISGTDFRYVEVSPNIGEFLGINTDKLLGKKPSEIGISSKQEEIIKQLQSTLDGNMGDAIEIEVKLRETGQLMILEKITETITDTNGKIVGILSIFEDVTEKKAKDEKEKRQRLLLKEAEEKTGIGSYRADFITGEWEGSPMLSKILGLEGEYNRKESEFFDCVHPEDKEMLFQYFNDIKSGKIKKFDKEYRIIRQSDGEIIWLHGIGRVDLDDEGNAVSLTGIIQDVTDRKNEEKKHRETTELLASIINGTTDLVSTKDTEGRFTLVNKSALEFFGVQESEMLGKTLNQLMGKGDCSLCSNEKEAINTGKTIIGEDVYLNRKGEERKISTMRGPIFDSEGNVKGIFSICRDITDSLQKEDQLKEAQKQLQLRERMSILGEVIGGVAHDFNNILTPIMGYVEMVLLTQGLSEDIKDSLNTVYRAAVRARDLVVQLKQMSKNNEIEKIDFDLHEVISEVFKFLINTTDRLVDKQLLIKKGLHNINGNKTQLHQVFLNLGVNAIQAMAERGVKDGDFIKVTAENTIVLKNNNFGIKEGIYVHIAFEDNGCGMSKEVLEKAFAPYFTTKAKTGGTGIGLAKVFNIIVENHSGAIYIDSTENVGTKVHIYLPLTNQGENGLIEEKVKMTGGNETILVVDDEEVISGLLKYMLEGIGYKVIVANNGREGLRIIKSNPDIDLVSLDLDMPGMNGEQFIESLPPDIMTKIIVSSGHSQSIKPKLLPRISGFVNKPFHIQDFASDVRSVLDEINKDKPK